MICPRALRLPAVLIGAVVLAGCTAPIHGVPDVQSTVSARYVEAQVQYTFPAGAGGLPRSQRIRVEGFLHGLALTRSDEVIATVPVSGNARLDAMRKRSMRALLSLYPAKHQVMMPVSLDRYRGRAAHGIVRVIRATGAKANCGTPGYDNLGCATATNLADMVADPGDILAPAQTGMAAQ